jgi:DNA recombination protein RmuC
MRPMNNVVFFILYLVLAFAFGLLIGWYTGKSHSSQHIKPGNTNPDDLAAQVEQTRQQLDDVTARFHQSQSDLAAAQASVKADEQQIAYLRSLVQQVQQDEAARVQRQSREQQERQEELARKDQQLQKERLDHQKDITAQAQAQHEASERLAKLMSPLSENMDALRKRIDTIERNRSQESGSVADELKNLAQQQRDLHEQTRQLSTVLGSNQMRGQWGEVQLRNLVEAAGMTNHVDFMTQQTVHNSEGGNSRPDMIIRLAGGRVIPVDAKTPLQAYSRALREDRTTPEGRAAYQADMRENVAEIRRHIDDLAKRDYSTDFQKTPDLTIAFIPSEAVLSAALEEDGTLLEDAFAKKVALCSPVSLWSVLKAVARTWQQVDVSRDAQRLYSLCRDLFAGFRTMGTYVSQLGNQLSRAVSSYNRLVGNLEHTILPKARKLDSIDPKKISAVSQLDGEDSSVRQVTASELNAEADVDVSVIASHPKNETNTTDDTGDSDSEARS